MYITYKTQGLTFENLCKKLNAIGPEKTTEKWKRVI